MKNLVLIFTAIAVTYCQSYAQVFDITIENPDSSLLGLNLQVQANEDAYVLIQSNDYYPGTIGIPIEGVGVHGSKILKVNNSGDLIWSNNYETSGFSVGKVTAKKMLYLDAEDKIILPYTIYKDYLQCENPTIIGTTYKFGLMSIDPQSSNIIGNRLVDSTEFCFYQIESNTFLVNDKIHSIFIDKKVRKQHFITLDNLNPISSIVHEYTQSTLSHICSDFSYSNYITYSVMFTSDDGFWLEQRDSFANVISSIYFPEATIWQDYISAIKVLVDGSYLIGFYFGATKKSELRKYDVENMLIWTKTYDDEIISDIELIDQDNYLLLGKYVKYGEPNYVKVFKIDNQGNTTAYKLYGDFVPEKIKKVNDSEFMFVGSHVFIDNSESNKTRVIKDLFENLTTSIIENNDYSFVSVYPNPVENTLNLNIKNTNDILFIELFDIAGKKLLNSSITDNSKIDVRNFPNGYYTYVIYSYEGVVNSGKFIKK